MPDAIEDINSWSVVRFKSDGRGVCGEAAMSVFLAFRLLTVPGTTISAPRRAWFVARLPLSTSRDDLNLLVDTCTRV